MGYLDESPEFHRQLLLVPELVAVAASYRRCPPAVVQAHPWMREMPAFCLGRILARRAAAAGARE